MTTFATVWLGLFAFAVWRRWREPFSFSLLTLVMYFAFAPLCALGQFLHLLDDVELK